MLRAGFEPLFRSGDSKPTIFPVPRRSMLQQLHSLLSFCCPSDVDLAIAKDPLPWLGLQEGPEKGPFIPDVLMQVDALDKDPTTSVPPHRSRSAGLGKLPLTWQSEGLTAGGLYLEKLECELRTFSPPKYVGNSSLASSWGVPATHAPFV